MDWKPIESAPDDGTSILASGLMLEKPHERFCVVVWWQDSIPGWGDEWAAYNESNLTHWMPLPPPPQE